MIDSTILDQLVELSHHLGQEWRDYVIVGEGNTSARIDADTFWIKASGASLRTIQPGEFVAVNGARMLNCLKGHPGDQEITEILKAARVDPSITLRPSVETFLHAMLYELTNFNFIGHTHPVAVNQLLCSERAQEITRHIMPDGVVVCGPHMVFVPYYDPGAPLTREGHRRVKQVIEREHETPRVVFLQNHGLLALGHSPRQVENVTAMAVKHASVLAATYALGGPKFLGEQDIARLHTRPDEELRRERFR